MSKIFCGNLSWGTNDETLTEAFSQYGNVVDAIVLKDRETGKSRGFGFVTMETPEEAQAAIDALQNGEIDGRNVTVNLASDRPERSDRGGFGGNRGGYRGGRGGARGGYGGNSGGNRGCFKCGEEGHISRDCPNGGGDGGQQRNYNSGGGGNRGCFKCGQEGHFARDCPGGGAPQSGGYSGNDNNDGYN